MSRLLVAVVYAASPCALYAADFVNMTASGDVGVAGHLGIGLPVNATQANVRLLVQDATYPTSFTGLGTTLGIGNGIPNNSFAKLTFGNNNGNAAAIGAQITGGGSYLYLGTSNAYASGITNSALVVDPNANVGIGTSAPSGLLHLFSNHADSSLMLDQPASPNFDTVIAFREQTTSVWNVGVDQSDASKFKIAAGANWNNLRTTADDFLTITTTGKVGIGATAPASRLSVQDTAYPAVFTGLGTTANIGYNLAYNQFAKLTFGAGTGGIGMTVTGSGSYLHLGTSNNYANGITKSAVIIDPNGLVGINNSTPDYPLSIKDSGNLGGISLQNSTGVTKAYIMTSQAIGAAPVDALRIRGDAGIALGTVGQVGLFVDTSNHVGVGTVTPSALFDVLTTGQGTDGIVARNTTSGSIRLMPNAGGANYNPLVQAGDSTFIYTQGGPDTGTLVIGPYTTNATPKGIRITAAGNVGIGMTNPTNALSVAGVISAKEIKVTTTGADYVFEDGYHLRSLDEVARYIAAEKHLPEMMPAKAMQDGGMPVAEVVTKQLAKIEELTLYAIHQQQAIDAQQAAQADQQKLIAALREQVAAQQQVLAAVNGRMAALETAGATQSAK